MSAVVLKFYPNQSNPRRASGRGVWRVKRFFPHSPISLGFFIVGNALITRADREYKVGSRVDPRRIVGV